MQTNQKFIYLICPVRSVTEVETNFLNEYVLSTEKKGDKVHYPPRDVNQVDDTGLRILSEHREVMKKVDEVHAYWNKESSGSYFDFGMAYMAKKMPWTIINREKQNEDFNDLERFIVNNSHRTIEQTQGSIDISRTTNQYNYYLEDSEQIEISFTGLSKQFLFKFGMAFFTEKPITIKNIEYLRLKEPLQKASKMSS